MMKDKNDFVSDFMLFCRRILLENGETHMSIESTFPDGCLLHISCELEVGKEDET